MSTTILGKLLKKLRVEHSETVNDMAKKLEITPSYLSSIGVGKRSLPVKQLELIKKHYHPSRKLMRQIFWAAEFSKLGVKINYAKLNETQRQLTAVFARNVAKLDTEAVAKCYQALNIPHQELRGWCSLLKQNQCSYKPLQHILEYIRNEQHYRETLRLILRKSGLNSSASARTKTDALQEQLRILQEAMPSDNGNLQALASSLKNSLQQLSIEITALAALLNRENETYNSSPEPSPTSSATAGRETEELYDTGPGQELLDF
ncbi:MAG: helix-turn-helix domain-containing protein [Candidatus Bruticola sp.]